MRTVHVPSEGFFAVAVCLTAWFFPADAAVGERASPERAAAQLPAPRCDARHSSAFAQLTVPDLSPQE